eukprot:TRINITY_DN36125_c0_g2_i3.p1 TRINITY_DN36125_c0_g2~~TRINITY_DN36125_c0_g2_i3.p1  ORF type:complete len:167 (-),score=29.04 TRINITY_DN36125_c0_g2_i3:43-543(-)
MMMYQATLALLLLVGFQYVQAASIDVVSDRTNYLLIMTDDQGYDDIGIHHPSGSRILHTPNMNKFANESVEFSNFYTTPLCATSRANLLTGRNHFKQVAKLPSELVYFAMVSPAENPPEKFFWQRFWGAECMWLRNVGGCWIDDSWGLYDIYILGGLRVLTGGVNV